MNEDSNDLPPEFFAQPLTPEVIEELKKRGWTQSKIAKAWGVSRQRVSKVKRQDPNYYRTPADTARESFPWRVPARFHGNPYRNLVRDHLQFMINRGKGLSLDRKRRLSNFYWELKQENKVVEYDPNRYPNGFALVPKRVSDGELIVRVNQYTDINPVNEILLRFPERIPVA